MSRPFSLFVGRPLSTGDLNKALKDLVTVITDQEIEQSDLNENEIEWAIGEKKNM